MRKKETQKVSPLPIENHREMEYNRFVADKLNYIPDPTYNFQVGDKVVIGNLEDVRVEEKRDNGKVYGVSYLSSKKGETSSRQFMYVSWLQIRKYKETEPASLIKNDDIRLSYHQSMLSDILNRAYNVGVNFNPDYQRDYVWSMQDKVALIDAIFNNVDIGKFVFIRTNDLELYYEILDGKQRLRAILDFYEDRFSYNGLYFSDLSRTDKYFFLDYSLSTAEAADLTYAQKLRYFLNLNKTGRVMAKEHLEKVEKMLLEAVR